ARGAVEPVGERRGGGWNALVIAVREDERVVAGAAGRSGRRRREAEGALGRRVGLATLPDRRSAGAEALAGRRRLSDAPARQADPHVDLVLEVVGADDPVRGDAALAVAGQDEVLDVLLADRADHQVDEVVQVLVIGLAPDADRR